MALPISIRIRAEIDPSKEFVSGGSEHRYLCLCANHAAVVCRLTENGLHNRKAAFRGKVTVCTGADAPNHSSYPSNVRFRTRIHGATRPHDTETNWSRPSLF
jgi:hypothetical protein